MSMSHTSRTHDHAAGITTDKSKACRFVETMHRGLPQYGVHVSPGKSLVNFDLTIGETVVPRLQDGQPFPYCGTALSCDTLEISKHRDNS